MAKSDEGTKLDDFLEHYGVKGMRWGVRRPVGPGGRVTKSEDRAAADALRDRKVATLSNAELRKLNERMQLEQTYTQLMSKQNKAKIDKGMKFGKNVLGTAKTAQEVYNLVNSPMGKAARQLIETELESRR